MKIALDISQAVFKGSGTARFTNGLIKVIAKYGAHHEWHFLFSAFRARLSDDISRLINESEHIRLYSLPFPPDYLSFLWNRLHVLNPEIILGKMDWIITSDWTEPPSRAKKATIIHDLAYLRYPETVDKIILNTQKK